MALLASDIAIENQDVLDDIHAEMLANDGTYNLVFQGDSFSHGMGTFHPREDAWSNQLIRKYKSTMGDAGTFVGIWNDDYYGGAYPFAPTFDVIKKFGAAAADYTTPAVVTTVFTSWAVQQGRGVWPLRILNQTVNGCAQPAAANGFGPAKWFLATTIAAPYTLRDMPPARYYDFVHSTGAATGTYGGNFTVTIDGTVYTVDCLDAAGSGQDVDYSKVTTVTAGYEGRHTMTLGIPSNNLMIEGVRCRRENPVGLMDYNLSLSGYAMYHAVHKGSSGYALGASTARDIRGKLGYHDAGSRIPTLVTPDVIHSCLAYNDYNNGQTSAQVKVNFATWLAAVKDISPRPKVVYIIPPCGVLAASAAGLRAYFGMAVEALHEQTDVEYAVVDCFDLYGGSYEAAVANGTLWQASVDPPTTPTGFGAHPTPAGAWIWSEAFAEATGWNAAVAAADEASTATEAALTALQTDVTALTTSLATVASDAAKARKALLNKATLTENGTSTIYNDDGTTPAASYTITDDGAGTRTRTP